MHQPDPGPARPARSTASRHLPRLLLGLGLAAALLITGLVPVLTPPGARMQATSTLSGEEPGGHPPGGRPPGDRDEGEGEEGKQLTPSEWFHLQRAYPGQTIPRPARLRGFAQAEALRRAAGAPDAPRAAWQPAGPTNIGGRITAVGFHPAAPLTIYAGVADGGVFRSDDFGGTWTPLFDEQNTLSIGAVAVHPLDAERLLVGTGEVNASGDSYAGTGLYQSDDGGASWEHLGLTETSHIGRIVFDPQHPDTLYVAALGSLFSTNPERGVYRSHDGGGNWELVHAVNDSTGCIDLVIDPDQPNRLYAAMWERIRRPHDRRVGGVGSGIWRSLDGGDSWTLLASGLPAPAPDVGRIGLAIAASNPQVLYAIYADHPGYFMGVYKTTDGGDSWSQVNDGALSNLYSSYGWFFGNIRVRPDDENAVYVMGLDIYRSTSGGSSWSGISSSIHVDQHDLVFNPADPTFVIAGNDGGIYTSFNGGSTWNKSYNLPVSQFYAITADYQHPERLYGGTQDNSTMRTMTGALDDWEVILGGDGFYTLVDPVDNNYVYAEYQWGNFYRSTNGGGGFSSATNGIPYGERRNWSTPVVMDPNDNETLYFGTYRIFRTTNRASDWTAISGDLTHGPGSGSLTFGTVTTIAVSPANGNVIMAGTDDANVWITLDGGGGWYNCSAALPERWCTRVAFDPIDEGTAYVTFSGYRESSYAPHVYRTTNYGLDWADISSNLPEVPVNVILVDPADAQTLVVGTDAGVYVSSNLGGTWAALGTGLPNGVVSDLYLHDPTRTLVAGTHGRSMWKIDVTQTTAVAAAALPSIPALLRPARPNPFRTTTTFVIEQPAAGPVTLGIYDVGGRLVRELSRGELPAGTHRLGWDGSTLSGAPAARGVYLARLVAGERVEVQKVLLER